MVPEYWVQFILETDLVGSAIHLDEQTDMSGLGADLRFLSMDQSMDEVFNFWPGIRVSKDGYVPVAMCLLGSGDYYYINVDDGRGGQLYRIYHDAVHEDGYDPDEAIVVVLKNYETVLCYPPLNNK